MKLARALRCVVGTVTAVVLLSSCTPPTLPAVHWPTAASTATAQPPLTAKAKATAAKAAAAKFTAAKAEAAKAAKAAAAKGAAAKAEAAKAAKAAAAKVAAAKAEAAKVAAAKAKAAAAKAAAAKAAAAQPGTMRATSITCKTLSPNHFSVSFTLTRPGFKPAGVSDYPWTGGSALGIMALNGVYYNLAMTIGPACGL